MSKLSFRAKALDPGKPMPVYIGDEIPDLPDFSAVNRTVPEMPTGMEKEEETEHHLQRALSAQQVYGTAEILFIPIPDTDIVEERYNKLYCNNAASFKLPKQYIHVQPWGMDLEIPEYDMDSEDEQWLNHEIKKLKMDVKPIKFENMMDRLEKGSGQMVVTLSEAKALLKEDDDLTMAVYDYWLNKRLRLQHSLLPQVKTERRDGSSTSNPYVAFRRRAEKMQTRKNRKNDEVSYEKMLKLRKDLNRALMITEMLKRREKSKKELLKLTIEVAEKRFQLQDWDGQLLEEANDKKDLLPIFTPVPVHISMKRDWVVMKEDNSNVRKKREYKKRKHKIPVGPAEKIPKQPTTTLTPHPLLYADADRLAPAIGTDDEGILSGSSPSDHDGDSDPDGFYSFRRKHGCAYHAPCHQSSGHWPWEQDGSDDTKYKYSLTSLDQRRNCLGYARRRIGRGSRVIFDRAFTVWDSCLQRVDWSLSNSSFTSDYNNHLKMNNIPHFQPTPCRNVTTGALDSQESLTCLTRGLSPAVQSQSVDLDVSDHLYFMASTCDPQQQPYTDSSANLTLKSDHVALATVARAATDTVSLLNGSIDFHCVGPPSTASAPEQRIEKPVQVPIQFPVVSNSQASGNDNVGLSTLPAASILQLNYPLNKPLRPAAPVSNQQLFTVNSSNVQPSMSRGSVPLPVSNHCRIVKPMVSSVTSLSKEDARIQQLVNSARKIANCPLSGLLTTNHTNMPALGANIVSAPGCTTQSSKLTDHSLLVPILKLPGTTANRNDAKQKDTHESLNHIAKDTVVGVEVT